MCAAPNELRHLMELSTRAAQRTGEALRINRRRWSSVQANAAREIKIEADRYAEDIILDFLQRESGYPILTEESGLRGSLAR